MRPFEDSPFRIGVSVHTPTFYNLKIKTNVRAVTYTPDLTLKLSEAVVDSYDLRMVLIMDMTSVSVHHGNII